jgi:hypothetical protein
MKRRPCAEVVRERGAEEDILVLRGRSNRRLGKIAPRRV